MTLNRREGDSMDQEVDNDGREKMAVADWDQGDQDALIITCGDGRDIGGQTGWDREIAGVVCGCGPGLGLDRANVFTDLSSVDPVRTGTGIAAGCVSTDRIGSASAGAWYFKRLTPVLHGTTFRCLRTH